MENAGLKKRTAEEIGRYFDGEVEKFSNLAQGQVSFMDSLLIMDLLASTARRLRPDAGKLLDIGCGAGNQTLNLLRVYEKPACTLLDVSQEMLKKAQERMAQVPTGKQEFLAGDLRNVALEDNSYDVAVACAVLHHMRTEADWLLAFQKICNSLKTGGCLLVGDVFRYDDATIQELQWNRYRDYLREKLGEAEAQRITESIKANDTPETLDFQFRLLKQAGFSKVILLHQNCLFCAYVAIK